MPYDSRKTVLYIGQLEPGLQYSRNNPRTCFRRCSKEDFKAVNTSIANIS